MVINIAPFASLLLLAVLAGLGRAEAPANDPGRPFAIEVVDEQTGRGVPMVELQTTYGARYLTDSNGLVAFDEPGLTGRKVFFGVASHGYEFARDGFGVRGAVLEPRPGGSARLKIKRINVAERLYRMTGYGVYRDTVLLGRKPPVAEPLLNAGVSGQDGVLNALYRGKLYWFYGDTNRLSYALGVFQMTAATSALPDKLDPSAGIDLKYVTDKGGQARAMAPIPGEGVVWLTGVVVLPDESGRERMYAYYQRRQGLGPVLENGFVVYNDETDQFEKLKEVPLNPPIEPGLYPFRPRQGDGSEYLCFPTPYPALRVKADAKSYLDLDSYEGYTCLKPGTREGGKGKAQLDRDADGKLVWAWKKGTPPLNPKDQNDLIAAGKMTREESPFRLRDAEGGKAVLINSGSCAWNDHRKRYVLIVSELKGATVLGEVWYAEADRPEGPWVDARKVITHANKPGDAHDFYNPVHHPFLDREGGRVIYLEGSYVNTFSGNPHPTPYYEYNQIMYRLDLADPRLKLPAPAGAGAARTLSLFDGKTLDGWKPTEFFRPGAVTVKDGTIVLAAGKPMTGITTTRKDLPTTDYELRYEAMRLTGNDFFAAATFPVAKSFVTLVNGGWGGGVTGLSSLNGADASENETTRSITYRDKTWYRFRVRVTGEVIRCWLDDKEIVAVNHEGREVGTRIETRANQPLGFAAWETGGALRNVEVRALTRAEVASTNKID